MIVNISFNISEHFTSLTRCLWVYECCIYHPRH